MKKSKFSTQQIAKILKEFDNGKSVDQIIRNGAEIREEYKNGKMGSYFEKREEQYFTITRGFSNDHVLFHTEVLYLRQNGKPYMCYNEVLNISGLLEKHYRKVNSKNQYSLEAFDSFEECLKYKPHIL